MTKDKRIIDYSSLNLIFTSQSRPKVRYQAQNKGTNGNANANNNDFLGFTSSFPKQRNIKHSKKQKPIIANYKSNLEKQQSQGINQLLAEKKKSNRQLVNLEKTKMNGEDNSIDIIELPMSTVKPEIIQEILFQRNDITTSSKFSVRDFAVLNAMDMDEMDEINSFAQSAYNTTELNLTFITQPENQNNINNPQSTSQISLMSRIRGLFHNDLDNTEIDNSEKHNQFWESCGVVIFMLVGICIYLVIYGIFNERSIRKRNKQMENLRKLSEAAIEGQLRIASSNCAQEESKVTGFDDDVLSMESRDQIRMDGIVPNSLLSDATIKNDGDCKTLDEVESLEANGDRRNDNQISINVEKL